MQRRKLARRRRNAVRPPSRRVSTPARGLRLQRKKIELLLEFALKIAAETNPDRLLQLLAEETRQILDAERCSVFVLDRRTDELTSKLSHGLEVKTIRLRKEEGIAGQVFITRKMMNIPDAYADPRFSRRFDDATGYRTKTMLAIPMQGLRGREVLGVLEVLNKKHGRFTKTDEDLLTILASHAAVAVENAKLYADLRGAQREAVFRLALMAEHRDLKDTAKHLRQMSVYCGLIAEAMGFSPDEVDDLKLVAPLHDIGKVATPDVILLKTGKLTESELGAIEYRLAWWLEKLKLSEATEDRLQEIRRYVEDIRRSNRPSSTQMDQELATRIQHIGEQRFIDRDGQEKPLLTQDEIRKLTIKRGNLTSEERLEIEKHTIYGARILAHAESPLMRLAQRIAISHHEHFDGTGYPKKLKGDEIPIEGRIVALADVFDALSSKRVYKRGWDLDEVLSFVRHESGKHFDPQVVSAFLRVLPKVKRVMNDMRTSQP